MTYTTEQLIDFLENERSACENGQRVHPMPDDADEIAVKTAGLMGAFLGAEKLMQASAYHDYRDQIHEYQRQHQVSGIVVETVELPNGETIRFPVQAHQLELVDGDMEILRAAKDRVVDSFVKSVQDGCYYLGHTIYGRHRGQWEMETTLDFIKHFSSGMEWAMLSINCDQILGHGFSLHTGYGEPEASCYIANKDSEGWYFEASTSCTWHGPPVKAEVVNLSLDDIVRMRKDRDNKG